MLFFSDLERSTVTLTKAELAALVAITSKDAARVNLAGVLFDPAARVGVATDGHRMMVAKAGAAPHTDPKMDSGESPESYRVRLAAAKLEHAAAVAAEETIAADRSIIVGRESADAWAKAAKGKESIRITWTPGTAGKGPRVDVCIIDAVTLAEGARWQCKPLAVQFPPWRAVMPTQPSELAPYVAVNATYLAEACTVLAKVVSSKTSTITVWSPEANQPSAKTTGSLSPVLVTAETMGDDGIRVAWTYVLMPMRADDPALPWKVVAPPAAKPAPAVELEADAPAPVAKRTRKRAETSAAA